MFRQGFQQYLLIPIFTFQGGNSGAQGGDCGKLILGGLIFW